MDNPVNDEDVAELVRDVWNAAVGIDLHPRNGPADDEGVAVRGAQIVQPPVPALEEAVTGRIAIEGAWSGTVSVAVAAALAEAAAAAMFGMEPGELTRFDIDDALGEVANMIGGGVKALLPGPCQLSLPTVSTGPAASVPAGVATLRFEDVGGRSVHVTIGPADEHGRGHEH